MQTVLFSFPIEIETIDRANKKATSMKAAANFGCSPQYEVKDYYASHSLYSAAIAFATMNSDSKLV